MAQLEIDVNSSADDVDASCLQWALVRVTPGSSSLPALPVLKQLLPHKLCEIICAYKLIDILYDLQQQKSLSLFENPLYPKHRISKFLLMQMTHHLYLVNTSCHWTILKQVWPLEDWVKFLCNARAKVQSLADYERSSATAENHALIVTHPTRSMLVKLLKDLFALLRNQDALKVLNNVVIVALHLACMFKGTTERTDWLVSCLIEFTCLSILTNWTRLFQICHPSQNNGKHYIFHSLPYTEHDISDTQAMLTDEEAAFLQNFIRMSEIQKICHALYGALLFSPLYLLTHRKLTGNAWDQEKMLKAHLKNTSFQISNGTAYSITLQLSKSLGNTKPAIIVHIERLLWEMLLAIATGQESVYEAMNNFFSKVDWDEIAMVSDCNWAYFSDGRYYLNLKIEWLSH